MADTKITALTALTAADPVNDMFPIVDVSDTTMAASGTTKKISVNNILGASGTATLASATITGALGAAGLNVTGATIPANGVYLGSANNLSFSAASTLGMTLNSTGLGIANGNVILSTSGKGIDFTAAGNAAGMTSELLNDYEEGTWTGTLTGATTDPTIPVTATGRYTKVGRSVTVQISFSNVITTGASGRIAVTGLPFTNNGTSSSCAPVLLFSMGTFTGSPVANLGVNESFLSLFSSITNAAFGDVTHNAGTTRFLTVSITYTV